MAVSIIFTTFVLSHWVCHLVLARYSFSWCLNAAKTAGAGSVFRTLMYIPAGQSIKRCKSLHTTFVQHFLKTWCGCFYLAFYGQNIHYSLLMHTSPILFFLQNTNIQISTSFLLLLVSCSPSELKQSEEYCDPLRLIKLTDNEGLCVL